MSKFCIHCGKQLEEGQECDCQAENNAAEPKPADVQQAVSAPNPPQNGGGTLDFVKNMFKFSVEFLKDPIGHIKTVAQNEDYKVGLFFVGLQALATAILLLIAIEKASGLLGSVLGDLGRLLDLGGYRRDIPYFSIFIKVLLIVIAQFFLTAGIFYGLGKLLFKGTGSFKAIMGAMGVATIPTTIIVLFSIIAVPVITMTFLKIATYLFVFSASIAALLNFVAAREALKITESKMVYLIPTGYIIYTFIVSLIAQEIAGKSIMKGLF